MKSIIIWIGAFWFAIINHLAKNNPDKTFFAYEKDIYILDSLKKTGENPYFFPWIKLPQNIEFLTNLNSLSEFDLVIIAIPAQFISSFISEIKNNLKLWVTILNLSKWIDNKSLKTVSDILKSELILLKYNYAILSWWMIAKELIEENILWADIWCENLNIWKQLKIIFENKNLKVNISKNYKNIEIIWSLKNIFAMQIWYLEGKKFWMSSIWYYFCEIFKELPKLIEKLWGDKNIDFKEFALWWDIIATCFWNSRNRYFWKLVWEGKTVKDALEILKLEKKHAEWYETLKWISKIIKESDLKEFKKIVQIFIS